MVALITDIKYSHKKLFNDFWDIKQNDLRRQGTASISAKLK